MGAVWTGHRPCSPDGLPYVGFDKKTVQPLFCHRARDDGAELGAGYWKVGIGNFYAKEHHNPHRKNVSLEILDTFKPQ